MSARVVALASAKGGSGKTMLASTFGVFLARVGYKVLLIDTDAATNGLSLLNLPQLVNQPIGAKGLFELDGSSQPHVIELEERLYLLPATFAFSNTEQAGVEIFGAALKRLVTSARDEYDFVILDAQAGSDAYAQVSISQDVCDQVVIVSEFDPSSAAGVERLKALFSPDLTYVRTWIVLNKVLPEFVDSFNDFLEIAKYASPIAWDADVVRAYAKRTVAINTEIGNPHTLNVLRTMRSLFGDVISDRLDAWLSDHASVVKEPVLKELDDVSRKLANVELEMAVLEPRSGMTPLRIVIMAIAVTVVVSAAAPFLMQYFNLASMEFLSYLGFGVAGVGVTFTLVTLLRSQRSLSRDVSRQTRRYALERERSALANRSDRLHEVSRMTPEQILSEAGKYVSRPTAPASEVE